MKNYDSAFYKAFRKCNKLMKFFGGRSKISYIYVVKEEPSEASSGYGEIYFGENNRVEAYELASLMHKEGVLCTVEEVQIYKERS